MMRPFLDRKTDKAVERQVDRFLTPPPAALPLPVAVEATLAQWAGVVVGEFVRGLDRGH